jgi:RNA polymerase sigma factor (sigma-70 family)
VRTTKDGAVRRQLTTLFNIGATRELTDGQLLERFSSGEGEAAELAFEALVERHGAMVLRVCRAQLVDPHDTQDAFQATFFILVKKARALWVRDSLGPWLHQVAFRTAACARSAAARRRRHEQRAAEVAARCEGYEQRAGSELERVLHEEINRLPECYRVPIVLCDLEAHTCEEAARRMGCPVGTVRSWRFRGRQRLRDRLIRLGLAPSAVVGAAIASDAARGAVTEEIVRNAARALSEWMTAGEVPVSVRMLVKGVMKAMIISKLRTTAAAFLAVVFLSAGLGAAAWRGADDVKSANEKTKDDGPGRVRVLQPGAIPRTSNDAQETWSLTLREAIDIGLDNAEIVRVISRTGPASKIAPLQGNIDLERFKSELMAHLRSIEQVYWNLSQAHVQLWAADRAVKLGEEVLKHQQAQQKIGESNAANIAEAAERLGQFNHDLVMKTSDVMTTERQLRNIMGLPPADNRRIIPVTAPTEARLEPDWEQCLAIMLKKQPDITRQKSLMKEAERAGISAARQARQKEYLKQIVHQTTHSLARFFLEIDAKYKQFQTASRLRNAAQTLLESQQPDYEKGRITVDQMMDAVSQWATAVATEAQYKSTYNTSIVALEEVKGTLLDYLQIAIEDSPKADAAVKAGGEPGAVTRAALEPLLVSTPAQSGPVALPPDSQPSAPTPLRAQEAGPTAAAGGQTVSFHFTIGRGSKPVEIRGSFTIRRAGSLPESQAPPN